MAEIRTYATPPYLYRYRRLGENTQREIEALLEGYVYCSSFGDMNDPMEGSHRVSARFLMSHLSDKRRRAVFDAQQSMGIASFSEVSDHEPMWAHYADQFSGLCVQYNTKRLLRSLADEIDLVRMMYSETPPTLVREKMSALARAKVSLSSKTLRWSSEREWRIFKPSIGSAEYHPAKCAIKLYLGSRITPDDEAAVRNAATNLDIPVVKMVIDAYSVTFSETGESSQTRRNRS